MRQIFSSTRLETVEGVATLLGQHGIQTRITNGRSYKGNRRGQFSYRDNTRGNEPTPTLWVVFPDDQPRAREVLREAGLMDTTRPSYLPETARPAQAVARSPAQIAARIRIGLLIAVVLLGAITVTRGCQQREVLRAPARTTPVAPAQQPPAEDPDSHIVPVDTSLL